MLLAVACAAKKADPAAGKTSSATSVETSAEPTAGKPAPPLPADVAQLAKPDPAAAAPATSGGGAGGTSLTDLQPTGEFVSPSRSEVAPKEPGRVAAVYVDAGARVSRGQPLLTLETDYFRLEVQRAEADLARARAAEADARRDFDRKKGLRSHQLVSG